MTTPNTPTPRAVEAMMCENCGCADDTVRAIPEVSRLAPGCRQYLCHRTESDCVAALKHQLTALRAGIEGLRSWEASADGGDSYAPMFYAADVLALLSGPEVGA